MGFQTRHSKELFARALNIQVEGGSSPSRGPANYGDYPLFMKKGQGAFLYDVDGNRYVDWMMAYGALPLGHAHPVIVKAIGEAAESGTLFATATEIELEVAELLHQMIPWAERVRFANTGTEATMAAIRLARGVTGKPKFIKFEGHYHGWFDDFLVNSHPHPITSLGHPNDPIKIADSSGLNRTALNDTVVVPWNDISAVERAIETHKGQIAAVITEGIMGNMGVIPPQPGYLKQLREITEQENIIFILDETVTGFRIAPGGCGEYYGVTPDIATYGKALGAGLPVAAFVGKAEIMDGLTWGGVLHYGTQNASRIGMYAARASLQELCRNNFAAFDQIWKTANVLIGELEDLFKKTKTPAIIQRVGPMFQIMFTNKKSIDHYRAFCAHVDRQRYQHFVLSLFEHGIYMSPSSALHSIVCLAHDETHINFTLEGIYKALK